MGAAVAIGIALPALAVLALDALQAGALQAAINRMAPGVGDVLGPLNGAQRATMLALAAVQTLLGAVVLAAVVQHRLLRPIALLKRQASAIASRVGSFAKISAAIPSNDPSYANVAQKVAIKAKFRAASDGLRAADPATRAQATWEVYRNRRARISMDRPAASARRIFSVSMHGGSWATTASAFWPRAVKWQ